MDRLYSCAHFVVEIDEKSILNELHAFYTEKAGLGLYLHKL